MTQKVILGLDIGTSSVRAALYDLDGNMLPETLVKNERSMESTDGGGSEIDAEVALKQVVQTIDEVLRSPAAASGEIEYVAPCCFWHSLVGVDTSGKPTTKVFGWADTRSGNYTSLLRKRFDENELHDRTGARFHSSFWPAKLLWLRNEFPDEFARTSLWLSFSDFVALRLFGIATTSISMASGTGVFDIRACAWEPQMLRFLNVRPSDLPLVSDGPYTFRPVEKFRKRWRRLKTAEWFPAIADGAANNIGAGCTKRSTASLMIGTSGAMRVAYEGQPPKKIPRGLWCYRVDRNRVILGGALSDGGGLYAWLTDRLRLASDEDIEAEIARREPAGHGLTFLPFVAGERSTGYHDNAGGAVIGLRSSTDTIDITQSALEAVAYRFAEIFDQLNGVCRIREIVASGGAMEASQLWTQIIADVLGRNLTIADTPEASMRGAVLLALETTGKIKKIENVPTPTGTKLIADRSRRAAYAAARKEHQAAYKILIDRERS